MKQLLLLILYVLSFVAANAQNDTAGATPIDTVQNSVIQVTPATLDTAAQNDTTGVGVNNTNVVTRPIDSFYYKLLDNPYLQKTEKPLYLLIQPRERSSKDEVFYLLAGLLLLLAFIKIVFSKYFVNIFRLFFQPQFRQKQIQEQLAQNNLPSLLLNLFFIISGAIYISLLADYYTITTIEFWWLFVYSTIGLLVIYIGKYLFLIFAGWVFNVKEATNRYIFVVYLINKIIGVLLLPFLMIIAFSTPNVVNIAVTISILMLGLLFIYRYVISYGPVRREVKVSPLHFFVYVLAFEITPLLLIYKTLRLYLENSL